MTVEPVYMELRELILRGDPHAHGWAPSEALPHVWGALVEVGLPEGPVTLVSLVDGTTSLYLGNGGGTIGAGEATTVAEATQRLLAAVEAALPAFRPTWEFPLPGSGQVRFVVLTYSGALAAEAGQSALTAAGHPLSSVFAASGAVLAEVQRLEAAMPAPGDMGPAPGDRGPAAGDTGPAPRDTGPPPDTLPVPGDTGPAPRDARM